MKTKNKGFTIVEIVIALVVISLVSLTATSLVIFSQNLSDTTRDRFFAVNLCENAIELFEAAANNKEVSDIDSLYSVYKESFEELLGKDLPALEDNKATIYMDPAWEQTTENEAKVTCILKFESIGEKTVRFEIEIFKHDAVLRTSDYTMTIGGQA